MAPSLAALFISKVFSSHETVTLKFYTMKKQRIFLPPDLQGSRQSAFE